ncbi:MAG: hypothetical protein ABI552_10285 [Casimicrobiaceae bacterium]
MTAGRDNGVQALRLAAAVPVIVFHCHALTPNWAYVPLYRLDPQSNPGLLGVQVFFMLSGFLVTGSHSRSSRRWCAGGAMCAR